MAEFFDLVNNVTVQKQVLPRGEPGKAVWGIKRFLSMHDRLLLSVNFLDKYHFALGDDRFYELMVYAMPAGRFRMKGVKKDKPGVISFAPGTDLWRRVKEYFHVSGEELHFLLRILEKEGLTLDDVKRFFGLNLKPVKVVKSASQESAGGRGRARRRGEKAVRASGGFQGVERERTEEDQ